MKRQPLSTKNISIYIVFTSILLLLVGTNPSVAYGFGWVLGKNDEPKGQQEEKGKSDEDEEDEKDEEDERDEEDEDHGSDEIDEKDDDIKIKDITVKAQGKTVKNNHQVEVKNQGEDTLIKTKSEFGYEQEFEVDDEDGDEDEIEVETEVETDGFKIKFAAKQKGSTITQSKFAAKTHYPLSVNSETNELIISTPAGVKVVTVLPDAAISNMLRRGVLDQVATSSATPIDNDSDEDLPSASDSSDIDVYYQPTNDNPILLTTDNTGEPVYKVKGSKKKRLLGILPVDIDKTVTVSAETGDIVEEEPSSLLDQFLNLLSL